MKRVFAHIGFSVALTLIILHFLPDSAVAAVLGILASALIISLSFRKIRQALAVPICIGSAILACLIFIAFYNGTYLPQAQLDSVTAVARFHIVDFEEETDDGYAYTVKTDWIYADGAPQNIKLRVKSENRINADYYDDITGELTFYLIAENGYQSYGYFGDGIFLSSRLHSYSSEATESKPIYYYILKIRENIKTVLSSVFVGDHGGIAAALLIGDKSLLSDDAVSNFKNAGVSHLMAVSGLHMAVISGAIYRFLRKLRVPAFPRTAVTVSAVLFYIGLAGFSKSVIRAGIMMIILVLGDCIKRKGDALNSLGLAVFILCLNPYAVTDASSLLTVTAVLGILTVKPLFDRLYTPKTGAFRFLYRSITVSFSVSLTTLPVLWFTYGTISLVGVVINVVMIPAAQFTMITALLVVLFQKLLPVCYLFAQLCGAGTTILLWMTERCSGLSISVLDISDSFFGIVLAAVFMILAVAIMMDHQRTLRLGAIFSAIFFVFSLFSFYCVNDSNTYIKITSDGSVLIYNSSKAVVLGVNSKSDYYTFKDIVQRKGLHISMILEPDRDSDFFYAEKLAAEAETTNFIVPADTVTDAAADHVAAAQSVEAELWNNLSVEYEMGENYYFVMAEVCEKLLCICSGDTGKAEQCSILVTSNSSCSIAYDYCVNLEAQNRFGIDFTINEGKEIIARRENAWLS